MKNVFLVFTGIEPNTRYFSIAIVCWVLVALGGGHTVRAQGDINVMTGVNGYVAYIGNTDAHGKPFTATKLVEVSKDLREGTFKRGENRPHDYEISMEAGFVYVIQVFSYRFNPEVGILGYESLDPNSSQARAYATVLEPYWDDRAAAWVFWSELAYHPYWDGTHYLRIAPPRDWAGGDYYVTILTYSIEGGRHGSRKGGGTGGNTSACTCQDPWEDDVAPGQCVHKNRPEVVACENQY